MQNNNIGYLHILETVEVIEILILFGFNIHLNRVTDYTKWCTIY